MTHQTQRDLCIAQNLDAISDSLNRLDRALYSATLYGMKL